MGKVNSVSLEMSKLIKSALKTGKSKFRVRRRKANARERARMKHLNEMFDRLRELMPIFIKMENSERMKALRKISKIDTLHLAQNYIEILKIILNGKVFTEKELIGILSDRISSSTKKLLEQNFFILKLN